MQDKDFKDRVPSLDRINRTNHNLTQGGFNEDPERDDPRSWFDEQGAARRRHVDDPKPEA